MFRAMLQNTRSTAVGISTALAMLVTSFSFNEELASKIIDMIVAIALVLSLLLQKDGDK